MYDPDRTMTKDREPMRPLPQKNALTRKWGYTDPRACEGLEATRKYIIRQLTSPHLWETLNKAQADYFLALLEFECNWKLGHLQDWRDFFKPSGDPKDEDWQKKVDGKAYYEQAKKYIDELYGGDNGKA